MTDVYGITKTAAGNNHDAGEPRGRYGPTLIRCWSEGRRKRHMLALVSASIFFLSWFAIVKKWDASTSPCSG